MAIFTGTKTKYGVNGIREDLGNVIYDISPEETPFISSLSRVSASNTLHEWQTDSLDAAISTNQQLEGDDIQDYGTLSSTVRVGNYTQISRKLALVSGTVGSLDLAGRNDELAYQLVKKGKELKRDMEKNALENIGGAAGSATVARKMAAIGAWLKTNTSEGTGGVDPTYTSGVPSAARTDGTQRAISTTIINNAFADAWDEGANPEVLMVGQFNKQQISLLTSVVSRSYDVTGAPKPVPFIGAVDTYLHDFGELAIVPNRFQRGRDAFGFDFDFLALAELRPMSQEKMAKTGDAEKRMMLVEWTLVVKNEAAQVGIFDLTTS